MIMKNDDNFIEDTTEIKQGNADVGPFVIGAICIITLVCLSYLVINIWCL